MTHFEEGRRIRAGLLPYDGWAIWAVWLICIPLRLSPLGRWSEVLLPASRNGSRDDGEGSRMLKKLLFIGAPLLMVLAFLGSFFWSARQPPEFYQEALRDVPPPEVRKQVVEQLVEQTRQLVNDLERAPRWSEEFTEEQINSWLAQEFEDAEIPWLPKGVHEPRIKLHDSLLKLAFRLQNSRIRGVVSCELQPWINGANQLTIGVRNVRLGLVPIPLEHLMQELQGHTALDGWRVSWRRNGGEGTVVLNLDQGKPVQPILETLHITEGALAVAGRRGPLSAAEPGGRLSLRLAPRPVAHHAAILGWLPPHSSR